MHSQENRWKTTTAIAACEWKIDWEKSKYKTKCGKKYRVFACCTTKRLKCHLVYFISFRMISYFSDHSFPFFFLTYFLVLLLWLRERKLWLCQNFSDKKNIASQCLEKPISNRNGERGIKAHNKNTRNTNRTNEK